MKILKIAMIFAVLAAAVLIGPGLRLVQADDPIVVTPPVEEAPLTGDMPQ